MIPGIMATMAKRETGVGVDRVFGIPGFESQG